MKHLPKINIEIIPHNKQRYITAGDYWLDKKGVWQFRISEMKSIYYEYFVLAHEMWEWFRVCIIKGIKEEEITKFDTEVVFIVDPKNGDDPGNSKYAIYHKEHKEATLLEKWLCKKSKLNWKKYNSSFNKL